MIEMASLSSETESEGCRNVDDERDSNHREQDHHERIADIDGQSELGDQDCGVPELAVGQRLMS